MPSCSSRTATLRPVRQEPSRRPQRACCRRCTASTNFFGNLYHLERRGRTGKRGLSEESSSFKRQIWAARRHQVQSERTGTTRPSIRFRQRSANRRSRTPARSRRSWMETVDEEITEASLDFMDQADKADKPFFCWFNSTRMHIWTHPQAGIQRQNRPRPDRRRNDRVRWHGRQAFEEAPGAYERWRIEHAFVMVPAQAFVANHLKTYVDFPPRQRPGSFSLDQVLAKLQEGGRGEQ